MYYLYFVLFILILWSWNDLLNPLNHNLFVNNVKQSNFLCYIWIIIIKIYWGSSSVTFNDNVD